MISDSVAAAFIVSCLVVFYAVNLANLQRSRSRERGSIQEAEVEHPNGLVFGLVALGTLLFFAESGLYVLLVFLNRQSLLTGSMLQLRFPYDSLVQLCGLFMTGSGYFLFIWSVLARGRYSTSWEMHENHRLVTWGPYRYMRHPSYVAYFILFVGQFLTLLNLVALVPLLAIPGYTGIAEKEEELLTRRFGEAYTQYQQNTGAFLPKLKK